MRLQNRKPIAKKIFLSCDYLENHLSRFRQKIGIHNVSIIIETIPVPNTSEYTKIFPKLLERMGYTVTVVNTELMIPLSS